MQNPIQKFRQSSIVFEEPVIFSEKWKTFNELQLPWCWIFFAETSHASRTYECLKKSVRDFLILFRSWVICKNEKDLASIHSFFTFLLITRDLNKRKKKIPNTLLLTLLRSNRVQNIKLCSSWSLPKFSIFQVNKLISQE